MDKRISIQKAAQASKAPINKAMNDYRGLGAYLVERLQSGRGLTNPETGVKLTLTTDKFDIDRRFLTSSSLNIDTKTVQYSLNFRAYADFYKDLKRLEARFASTFYNRIIASYQGSGRISIASLAPKTVANRKAKKVLDERPYMESGEFVRQGIIYDPSNNVVYLNPGTHSVSRGEGTIPLSYASIYFLNEFGRQDLGIPPRPVWRPILRMTLKDYERHIRTAYTKRFG